jgi:hypothetical protein
MKNRVLFFGLLMALIAPSAPAIAGCISEGSMKANVTAQYTRYLGAKHFSQRDVASLYEGLRDIEKYGDFCYMDRAELIRDIQGAIGYQVAAKGGGNSLVRRHHEFVGVWTDNFVRFRGSPKYFFYLGELLQRPVGNCNRRVWVNYFSAGSSRVRNGRGEEFDYAHTTERLSEQANVPGSLPRAKPLTGFACTVPFPGSKAILPGLYLPQSGR